MTLKLSIQVFIFDVDPLSMFSLFNNKQYICVLFIDFINFIFYIIFPVFISLSAICFISFFLFLFFLFFSSTHVSTISTPLLLFSFSPSFRVSLVKLFVKVHNEKVHFQKAEGVFGECFQTTIFSF